MRHVAAAVAATCFISLTATSAQARETRQQTIQHAKQRFYHADGYIKAIGKNARRTIYNPHHQIRMKWKRDLHYLVRMRTKAWEILHPKPVVYTDWRAYLLHLVGSQVFNGCALPLIGRESGGVVTKYNYGGSGAYGLGQALPASKMASYGRDYLTNGVTQIRWMDAYVRAYGGWCAANAFQQGHNWY